MDFSSVIKKGQPSVEPHELTFITDPEDPLYDARIELPVSSEAVLNFAAVGQAQPVAVTPRGLDELIPVDGLQRAKRALVINHLTGRKTYDGEIISVREAITNLRGTSMGKRIIEEAPGGMKLQVVLYRGTEKEALRAKASANFFRDGDALAERIRKALHMARHGIEHEQIALDLGTSLPTIKRWMSVDPDKPRTRKAPSGARKPGPKKLRAVYAADGVAPHVKTLIGWVLGEVSKKEFVTAFPELAKAVGR